MEACEVTLLVPLLLALRGSVTECLVISCDLTEGYCCSSPSFEGLVHLLGGKIRGMGTHRIKEQSYLFCEDGNSAWFDRGKTGILRNYAGKFGRESVLQQQKLSGCLFMKSSSKFTGSNFQTKILANISGKEGFHLRALYIKYKIKWIFISVIIIHFTKLTDWKSKPWHLLRPQAKINFKFKRHHKLISKLFIF